VTQPVEALASAREQFLALVAEIRPELHRYCARLTGSVIEGEDIVQDTLAKAFYALSLSPDVPPLRPWLFRIAHNAAIDFLRGHGRKLTDPSAELDDMPDSDAPPDPAIVRAALARFAALPLAQRSAVILKESSYILVGVVKVLTENPEIKKVRVEGHTDTQGKPKHNKKLSERRAASVVKWLVKYGIDKRRLTSAGFGQERPIATNQTEEGRRENRRVELHIVEGPGSEP